MPVLIGHNVKTYDTQILCNHLMKYDCVDSFMSKISGVLDTLPLFKEVLPHSSSFKQEFLVKSVLRKSYSSHNSVEDVKSLKSLFLHVCNKYNINDAQLKKHSFRFKDCVNAVLFNENKKINWPLVKPLVENGVVTKCIANKIAGSGLTPDHLKLAIKRKKGSIQGLFDLLCEPIVEYKTVRVCKSKQIVQNLFEVLKW